MPIFIINLKNDVCYYLSPFVTVCHQIVFVTIFLKTVRILSCRFILCICILLVEYALRLIQTCGNELYSALGGWLKSASFVCVAGSAV